MGQQQLLLIVLGVIIVGIAVVVGINLFTASAEEAAKDTLVSEGTNIGALAQQYYKKPEEMGGGGGDFTGFVIPEKLASTMSADWEADVEAQQVTLTGTPKDESYTWTVVVTVTPNNISTQVQAGD
jgi:hypothetical protein